MNGPQQAAAQWYARKWVLPSESQIFSRPTDLVGCVMWPICRSARWMSYSMFLTALPRLRLSPLLVERWSSYAVAEGLVDGTDTDPSMV